MKKKEVKAFRPIRFAWLVICAVLGTVFIIRGEIPAGSGLVGGAVAGIVAEIIRGIRRKRILDRGEVLFDERDIITAGRAAIFTIRVVLYVMAVGMLAVALIDMYWNPPVLPVAAVVLGLISFTYSIAYKVMRNREVQP